MSKIKDLIQKESNNNPKLKKEFNHEYARLKTGVAVMKLRENAGLTQREFALRVGKKQPAIAKIESGNANVTIDTLQDYADKMGKELVISFK